MANTKIPYVIIKDESGINLATNLNRQGLYVTHFRYTFDDDDEDKCTIRLEAKSVSGIKASGIFVYDLPLRVSWGYVGLVCSPVIVYIRDIKTRYGSDSLYIELECTDLSSYLKSFKTQGSGKVSVLEYLKMFIEDKYRASIIHNGKVIWKSFSKLLTEGNPWLNPNPDDNFLPSPIKPNPLGDLAFSTDFRTKEYVPPEPVGYEDNVDTKTKLGNFLNTPLDIISANISPHQVLRNIFRQAPDGPWFISGTGNNITIHNRNLNSSPILSYTYWSDNSFLDFTVNSKRESSDAATLNYTTLDPANRIVRSRESYIRSLEGLKPISSVIQDKSLSAQDKKDKVKKLMESYLGYLNYGTVRNAITSKDWVNAAEENINPNLVRDKGYKGLYVPKGVSPGDQFHAVMNNLTVAGYIYSSPLDLPDAEFDTMSNVAKEIEMGRMEADLKTEGNIHISKNCIIKLSGLLPEHNGNWYVKKCDHELGNGGYNTNSEVFLISDKNSQSSFKTETDIKDKVISDIEKVYETEKKLFGELNKIKITLGDVIPGKYYLPGVLATDYSYTTTVAEFLQSGGIDENQDIDKLIRGIEDANNTWVNTEE